MKPRRYGVADKALNKLIRHGFSDKEMMTMWIDASGKSGRRMPVIVVASVLTDTECENFSVS